MRRRSSSTGSAIMIQGSFLDPEGRVFQFQPGLSGFWPFYRWFVQESQREVRLEQCMPPYYQGQVRPGSRKHLVRQTDRKWTHNRSQQQIREKSVDVKIKNTKNVPSDLQKWGNLDPVGESDIQRIFTIRFIIIFKDNNIFNWVWFNPSTQ